jgi:hypothetical protein
VDLWNPNFVDLLRQLHVEEAPDGYAAWLDRNLAHYDPVFKSWKMRDSLPPNARTLPSLKCWDDRCMHYVYGFYNQDDRDSHAREHGVLAKRDSGLSVGSTPTLTFPPDYSSSRLFNTDYSRQSSAIQLPKPTAGLAPLTITNQARERRDSMLSYSFASEYPGPGRGSIDSEVDPLLPPLKRSKGIGHPRLESITELKLLQDVGPCLRCKVLGRSVRITRSCCVFYNLFLTSLVRFKRAVLLLLRSTVFSGRQSLESHWLPPRSVGGICWHVTSR